MTERVFLEQVGNCISVNALGTAKAWEIRNLRNDPTIPPLMYVVESDAGGRLVLGRELCGRQRFNLLRALPRAFADLFCEQLKTKVSAQYLILKDAYPLDFQYAIAAAAPYDRRLLPTTFVKLEKTQFAEGAAREAYNFEIIGAYQGDTWLLPETVVASGTKLARFLRNGFLHHRPKEVYLLTAWGSLEGIRRAYQECRKHEVSLIPVFSQCMFGISETGGPSPHFVLSAMDDHSVGTRNLIERAYGRYQGTRMCSVGDAEMSLENPVEYSIQTLSEMQSLGMDPGKEYWEAWTVDVHEKSFQEKLGSFNPDLLEYFEESWKA